MIPGAGRVALFLALALPSALAGSETRAAPPTTTLTVRGLSAPVRLLTDLNGIPHLKAASLSDLYFAWGFVTARDRMWQLEASRRSGQGRMWEWLGNRALRGDGGAQLFEFEARARRAWERERSDAATREALERFAAGVNAYLALCRSGARPWAAELAKLHRQPEDWRPEDAYLLLYGMGVLLDLDLPELAESDTLRVRGADWYEKRRRFESDYQYTTIPDSVARRLYGLPARPRLPGRPLPSGVRTGWRAPGISFGRDPEQRASDIFAVGGGRASRGLPLLANDVHLSLTTPSPLYAIHVTVDGVVDAAGACVPGLPIIVSGRNRECAWGITALSADVIDLYADTLSADGRRVRHLGRWEPVREADYSMRFQLLGLRLPVFGQKRRYTPHGPVVALDKKRRIAFAARWAAFDEPMTLHDLLGLERSVDAAEVARRAASLVTPSLNIVAVDRGGHVRYQTVGAVPHRAFEAGRGAFPSDPRHEWQGFIPRDSMPAWDASPRDFVANGNNLPIGRPYPEAFPRYDWAHDRAARIAQRLAGDARMTLADMASVQNDIFSRGADRILPRLLAAAGAAGVTSTPAERAALDTLRAWDRRAARIEVGPSLFRAWIGCFYRTTGLGDAPALALAALDGRAPEVLRGAGGRRITAAVAATAALDSALASLTRLLGQDPGRWKWGSAHRGRFRHSLAWLDPLFQPFAIPMDGDNSTPSVGASHLPTDVYVSHGPAWRHVVDLADPDSSLCVMPPGNGAGRHSMDQLALWAHHGYVPLYLSWQRAETIKEDELELVPGR